MTWKGKKVLVTGASGFIGTHLVRALVAQEAKVIGMDIVKPRDPIKNSNVENMIVDIVKGIPKIQQKIDVIFHLAAAADPNYCENNSNEAFQVNVNGLFNILTFAKNNNISKIVFPSSAQLYGRNPEYFPIDEKHPIESTQNVYTITKKIGEDLCNYFINDDNMSITILRLFNVFGPFQSKNYFIPTVIDQALRENKVELWSEKPTRDWNYVENTVDALLSAGDSRINEIFNVGSGKEIKVGELGNLISKKLNSKLKFLNKEVGGSLRLQCDYNKIKNLLNWEPKIDFEKGLEQTICWYENEFKKK